MTVSPDCSPRASWSGLADPPGGIGRWRDGEHQRHGGGGQQRSGDTIWRCPTDAHRFPAHVRRTITDKPS